MNKCMLAITVLTLLTSACAGEEDSPSVELGEVMQALVPCSSPHSIFSADWSHRPTFSRVTSLSIDRAVAWLTSHARSVTIPNGTGSARWIVWHDDSLGSDVAYLNTDALWARHALYPYDRTLSDSIKSSLRSIGRWGNGQHDVLFRDLEPAFQPTDSDTEHGQLLGDCSVSGGGTVQVRAFNFRINQSYTDGHSSQFIDSAVYRALDEYWAGTASSRATARIRLADLITDDRPRGIADKMFWDSNLRVFVDESSRPDYNNGGNYTNATFKIGLVLYALKVMGVTSSAESAMRTRLREAQWTGGADLGGFAHSMTYNASGTLAPGGRSKPTGEATSIAIMASTVNFVP